MTITQRDNRPLVHDSSIESFREKYEDEDSIEIGGMAYPLLWEEKIEGKNWPTGVVFIYPKRRK